MIACGWTPLSVASPQCCPFTWRYAGFKKARCSMKKPLALALIFISNLSSAQGLLNTCEYAADVHKSKKPIVFYPAAVGGCVGHLAGYGAGLVLSAPFALIGAMEVVEPVVASFGEAGNKSLNYVFGLPGSLILEATEN